MQSDRHARSGTEAAGGDPTTGRLLDGRYRIGPRIARGGMASVYEATDIRLDRTVAVKIMHPGMGDDEEFAARFVREARAAARLSHPHVVAVYDQGEEDGTVYLAMELIPGHTLRDVIRKEAPMTPSRALALMEPVLSALAAAHRAGLIHRDVKPENVLIADDGRVKVADFGLAKAVSADTQHTATGGVLIGTVSYLAPELVVDGRADARADVYAAGVVLYELLTGSKPHAGDSPIQVAYKHVHEDVPPPSAVAPGIPAYVDALVARATARDRSLRPADAAVLLHQVHRVGQALADGVQDDPELTADLAPMLLHPDTGELVAVDDEVYDGSHDGEVTSPIGILPGRTVERMPAAPARTPAPVPSRPGPPPARPPARRRRWRGPVTLLLLLALVLGVAVGAWWFGWARYTSTPAVLDLTRTAAEKKLDAAGLQMELGGPDHKRLRIDGKVQDMVGQFSETVPVGRVADSDPDPGARILDGGTVTVVLSLGPERYKVPSVKGLTEDQAQDAITGKHLDFGESIGRWSDSIPAGTVLGSDPRAGTVLRPGTAVNIFISKGPKPVEVRDWTGRDADKAQAWFEDRGLVVDRGTEEYDDNVAEGHVISQTPASGTLHRGDTVKLVVSKGPELVEVPGGIIASGVDAARAKLEALGFRVDVQNSDHYLGLGYVYEMDPHSGDMVPRGSTITLFQI
ncbi:serine/threonine-protein kinase [Nocardioides ginsengisegetis]|uniref:non-specific serine/threonine protein kinase n=1 Tax=Nocardioides ginsengisegetis TaxID=661491 RepID=A0A7W3P9Z9_9ACTN|nr:serine/threonine-protein kinase [Nocardioides ginsengisegetis]